MDRSTMDLWINFYGLAALWISVANETTTAHLSARMVLLLRFGFRN